MVNDGARHRKYVERTYTIQRYEVDHFMVRHLDFVVLFLKVFLLGSSESGMVAAKTTILAWTPRSQAASLLHTLAASTVSLRAQRLLRSVRPVQQICTAVT